jgi:hypothetical protein
MLRLWLRLEGVFRVCFFEDEAEKFDTMIRIGLQQAAT